ncbi:hypothetical protein JHK87_048614 [Glycine soja]|nr:hypothetical protein JHK87_048614 [Glycine soja]
MLRLIEERRNSEVSNLKSHTKSEIQTSWGPSTLHSHSVHHGHHPKNAIYTPAIIYTMERVFKESSEEERVHAEKLMEYQNKRGGKVKLQSIVMPLSEFGHEKKGDALYDTCIKYTSNAAIQLGKTFYSVFTYS